MKKSKPRTFPASSRYIAVLSISGCAFLACFPGPSLLDRLDMSEGDLAENTDSRVEAEADGQPDVNDLGPEDAESSDTSSSEPETSDLDSRLSSETDHGATDTDQPLDVESSDTMDTEGGHDTAVDTADDSSSCTADCDDAQCGDDGCGGTCGTCEAGLLCSEGHCVGAAEIALGSEHTCVLVESGEVWCFGSSARGIVPGGEASSPIPLKIEGLPALQHIKSAGHLMCGWEDGGQLYCWGADDRGQITFEAGPDITAPTEVVGFDSVELFDTGGFHSCARNRTTLRCWGANSFGQLSAGEQAEVEGPVISTFETTDLSAIVLGSFFGCATYFGAGAQCVGVNAHGQLGDGTTTLRTRPQAMSGDALLRSISVGSVHGCGRDGQGAVYCWGANFSGEVGDGTFERRRTPVPVTLPDIALGVAVSDFSSCAWLLNEYLYCWGSNRYGQLGDGAFDDSPLPVRVLTSVAFESVALGSNHACGIDTTKRVHCWGQNDVGQSGVEGQASVVRPRLVEFATD